MNTLEPNHRRTDKESDITPISIKHTTTQDELLLVSCNHIYSVCSIQTSQMERKSITLRFHRPSPTLECLKPFVVFNPKGKRLEFMPHVQVPFFSILLLLLRTQLPSSSLKIYWTSWWNSITRYKTITSMVNCFLWQIPDSQFSKYWQNPNTKRVPHQKYKKFCERNILL